VHRNYSRSVPVGGKCKIAMANLEGVSSCHKYVLLAGRYQDTLKQEIQLQRGVTDCCKLVDLVTCKIFVCYTLLCNC